MKIKHVCKKHYLFLFVITLLVNSQIKSQNIHQIVAEGNPTVVKELLEKNPLLVNEQDQYGRTPIYAAIFRKNVDVVKLLLENGASVRVGDNTLTSPIHFAGFMNDTTMIKLLLEEGAVIDTRAIGAASPLIHSSLMNRFPLSKFLIKYGADINIQCNSLTVPIYFAALNNNIDYLNYLLDLGADLNTEDYLGRTPLSVAVRDGYFDVVKSLIENGADYKLADPCLNRNLLHLAAIRGRNEIIELLIDKGLNLDTKDENGYTPLDYANKYGHSSTAELLKKFGANTSNFSNLVSPDGLLSKDIAHGESVVIKLQNGSWGIKTEKHFLILGYSEIGMSPEDRSLASGFLTNEEMESINCIFYDLTFHPASAGFALQGQTPIYSLAQTTKSSSFVLNSEFKNNYFGLNLSNAFYPELNKTIQVENTSIMVLPSYENNKCYLIECDGLNIIWLSTICDNYIPSKKDISVINIIKEKYSNIDLLFLGTPDGIGPEKGNGIRETFIESISLNAGAVFFMGKEQLERRIITQIERRDVNTKNVHCAENPGDYFYFNN